jgi:Domain of unknown function (DUF4430)
VFRRLITLATASLAMPLRGRGGLAVAAACTAVALVAVLATPALAERVHVRVEGRTTTIFGAAEPTLNPSDATALGALEAASIAGEFYYHVNPGPFVNQIGRFPGIGFSGWAYKVNGVAPPVSADQARLQRGDSVLWYWATFSEQGSTPTLLLKARRAPNCYSVFSQDDLGRATPAVDATLRVDGRRVMARGGRGCVGKHRGLVRATAPNAVRSNALR